MNRSARILALFALWLAFFTAGAFAQQWPTHPVKFIVPFPPGGGTDGVARAVAAHLSQAIGQPFVVENRGGAGGTIGANAVATAAPDGYTIGIATSSTHPAALVLQKDVPYHPLTSFEPITLVANTSYVLLGSTELPGATLADMVAYARANPGKLNIANVGTSTLGYLVTMQMKALSGTDMLDVSYKGAAQVYPELIANRVQLFIDNPGASGPLVTAGRLRAYAVTVPTPSLPGVPLFSEAGASVGLKDFDSTFWYGLVAPAGTPRAIVARIQSEVAKFVQSPEGRKEFAARSLEGVGSTPEQFAATIRSDVERFSALAKQFNIKPQ